MVVLSGLQVNVVVSPTERLEWQRVKMFNKELRVGVVVEAVSVFNNRAQHCLYILELSLPVLCEIAFKICPRSTGHDSDHPS